MRKIIVSLINLSAYCICLGIMLLFNYCQKAYGQEHKILGNMHEYEQGQYSFSSIRSVPDSVIFHEFPHRRATQFKASLVTTKMQPKYYPVLYASNAPLHKGEYSVSGVIGELCNGYVYGMGWQTNLIGLGVINYAGIGYRKSLSDNLSADVALHAMKLSIPRFTNETFGISGKFSFSVTPQTSLHVFGNSYFSPATSSVHYGYGSTISFDATSYLGAELGVRGYHVYPFNQGNIVPVVMPYYKTKRRKIEMDFGGLLQGATYGLF